MQIKRSNLTTGFGLLIVIAAVIAVGCASFIKAIVKEPKISFASVSVRDAKPEGATAVIALNVENPNGVELTVDRLQYALELGGRSIASNDVEKIATIGAHKTTTIEIPVPFRYDQVFASILDLLSKGTASYKVTGVASIGMFKLPFDHVGDVKLRE